MWLFYMGVELGFPPKGMNVERGATGGQKITEIWKCYNIYQYAEYLNKYKENNFLVCAV
jgi:hypothetical protein